MRAQQPRQGDQSWFRIENATVDEATQTADLTKVYIYDSIGDSFWGDSTSASDFIKQLSGITTPNIELHLNSPGGDIFDGVAIYNALKAHPAKVTVIVDALAASAASFIAQAGDEVVMTKAATMMIHDGSAMAWGNASDLRDTADLLDKLSNTVAEIYADRAGQNIEFWRNLMQAETWYNSHEAVASGLADKIGEDTKQEDDQAAQNKWDLSIFNYAGRGAAPDPFKVRQRIANQLKEITVGQKPQNTGAPAENQPPEEDKNPASPETAAGVEGEDEEQRGIEREGGTDPGSVPNPPSQAPENKATVQPTQAVAGNISFVVDGETVTLSVQEAVSQLAMLTQFRNETLTQGRKNFVESLARDNKIMAAQIDKLTAYALSLDDAGFDAWSDTWAETPSNSMLGGSHAQGTTNHDGPQSHQRTEAADQLDIARDIVAHHKRSGMPEDKIKETSSYKALVAADPNFKL